MKIVFQASLFEGRAASFRRRILCICFWVGVLVTRGKFTAGKLFGRDNLKACELRFLHVRNVNKQS